MTETHVVRFKRTSDDETTEHYFIDDLRVTQKEAIDYLEEVLPPPTLSNAMNGKFGPVTITATRTSIKYEWPEW